MEDHTTTKSDVTPAPSGKSSSTADAETTSADATETTAQAEHETTHTDTAASANADTSVRVQVRQGKERLEVVVASPDSTVEHVKQQLYLATAVPVNQMKLLIGGKAREDHETLAVCGKASGTKRRVAAMLTFTAKFHDQADGGEYLASAEAELKRAAKMIFTLKKQLKHRMCDMADASVQISMAKDILGNLACGLDRVSVPPSALERKKEVVVEMNRLVQELSDVHQFSVVTER